MQSAGLVESAKEGLYVTYRLSDPSVGELLLTTRKVAEARLAEVAKITRDFLAENAQLDAVDVDDVLREKVRNGATAWARFRRDADLRWRPRSIAPPWRLRR